MIIKITRLIKQLNLDQQLANLKMKIYCPICKKKIVYDQNNEFRPFCSKKCKLIDLGAWASEDYSISGKFESGDSNENF